MSKRKLGGMLMSPNNGSGGLSGRKKPPTGEVTPAAGGGEGNGGGENPGKTSSSPMEVVFKAETFRKLIIWTLGPMLVTLMGAASAFFYFYHRTNVHIEDPSIHLTRGEREKLETTEEAKKARLELKTQITSHFDVKVREIKLEQKEELKELSKGLVQDQNIRLNKILDEVKKARKDIQSQ